MSRGRSPLVVDTNVPIVANRRNGESYSCASKCAQRLLQIRRDGLLLLDTHGLILEEYKRYLNFRGQPGVGDKFLKWFVDNRGRSDLCKEVGITAHAKSWRLWQEFPEDDRLSQFDPADQKFVAVANAHEKACTILQATDRKWLQWYGHLNEAGITVDFLCEAELATPIN